MALNDVNNQIPADSNPSASAGAMDLTPPAGLAENSGLSDVSPTDSSYGELPVDNNSTPDSSKTDGLKRQLLQKLMSSLLSKPGRSVNELVNGVKDVMGAYKSYSREIDNLSGISESPITPSDTGDTDKSIQSILDKVRGGTSMSPGGEQGGLPPTDNGQGDLPPADNNKLSLTGGNASMPPQDGNVSPDVSAGAPTGEGGPGYSANGYIQPPPISRLGIWGY